MIVARPLRRSETEWVCPARCPWIVGVLSELATKKIGVLSELAMRTWPRCELGEHADFSSLGVR